MKHSEIRARLLQIIATESDDTAWTVSNKHLMSLITFYVEQEREACAKICDSVNNYDNPMTANDVAEEIRARGAKDGE